MVAFAFCPKILRRSWGPTNDILLVWECSEELVSHLVKLSLDLPNISINGTENL